MDEFGHQARSNGPIVIHTHTNNQWRGSERVVDEASSLDKHRIDTDDDCGERIRRRIWWWCVDWVKPKNVRSHTHTHTQGGWLRGGGAATRAPCQGLFKPLPMELIIIIIIRLASLFQSVFKGVLKPHVDNDDDEGGVQHTHFTFTIEEEQESSSFFSHKTEQIFKTTTM